MIHLKHRPEHSARHGMSRIRRPLQLLGLVVLLLVSPAALFAQLTQVNSISTVAGNGAAGYSGDGGSATSASVNLTYGVVLDSAGNFYFADSGNQTVREVHASTGIITTVAGTLDNKVDGHQNNLRISTGAAYHFGKR